MNPAADLLNHLLLQNSWAFDQLRPHAGKRLRLFSLPLQANVRIDTGGRFELAPSDSSVDAEITLTPDAALRLLLQPKAPSLVKLQGDSEFAMAVCKVLAHLRWDLEEDLSRLIGDIPAHALARAGHAIRRELLRQVWAMAGMLAEYWLEEQPLIAKQHRVQQFAADVDALRDAVERLEKRLQRLESRN